MTQAAKIKVQVGSDDEFEDDCVKLTPVLLSKL